MHSPHKRAVLGYVELAHRLDLPIATRDRGMATAARAAGVPVFDASTS